MFPILFSFGNFSVSTLAIFVTFAFLFGVFTIWRLSRAWDFDEEKALDLTILTFFGAIVLSRLYFVSEHLNIFMRAPLSIILVYKIPGFSFWGGFLGGWLTLYMLCRKNKLDFWHVADLASVAFLGSLIFTDLGCFFGGCGTNVWASLTEAVLTYLAFVRIWPLVTHFHTRGYVVGISLITLGVIKIILEPLRGFPSENFLFSTTFIILGFFIFYKVTGRNFLVDLKSIPVIFLKFFTDPKVRLSALQFIRKWWYNQKTLWAWKIHSIKKNIKRINAKST